MNKEDIKTPLDLQLYLEQELGAKSVSLYEFYDNDTPTIMVVVRYTVWTYFTSGTAALSRMLADAVNGIDTNGIKLVTILGV